MVEKTVKENMLCFNFSCPDFISRYRLSKQAEKKVVRIKHLAEDGSKIGTVSHPRENPLELEVPSSRDYEDFHSGQKLFKGIVDALKDSNVNMIGVYGTGGVGKTTMVEKVGKLLKEDGTFDEVVRTVVSYDANVTNIQGQLADRLNLTLSGETEVGRANQLWNRLDNEKKNLIILDDIWQELDLTKIGIPIRDGNKRCKVVLTSRNRDVWKNMDVCEYFHVKLLTEEEAWTLFKKKVGNHVDSHDDPRHDIARAICKECQGLPVAINAIGAALKGKDLHAWKDALHKLKNSMLKDIEGIDPKVYASLKWNYDQLESEDAKSCFLLCCLFAEDAEISIDDLVRYYMAWRILHPYQMLVTLEQAFDQVCTIVDTLKSCCLLLDGESKHLVKMHDVVRDIAISIAEDEKSFLVKHGFKDWPEKAAYEHCSVISLRPDDVHKFPDELVCSELHILRLDCAMNGSLLQVPDEFFIGTGNLMVLDLKEVSMSPLLPASLAKLAKLQMLCLNQCHLGDISILKDLKDHLEILSLRGSNIEVLPPEVGELTLLRLLDMSDCQELEIIPKGVISKLFRLEELRMPMSFGKWEGTTDEREISNASLDELMSLTRLTTLQIWIPNAALLPKDLSFEDLVRFEIIISESFDNASDWDLTGILILENFHVANNLEFLLGKPKRSKPRNGLYPYLIDLSVIDCGMKYLFSPSCARELVGLQRLTIKHCGVMEGVIETEKDKDEDIPIIFSGLKLLNLENLPNLISFYPEKGKTATSSGSSSGHAQTVLFNDKVTFPRLENLKLDGCESLRCIFQLSMARILVNLQQLIVHNCSKMEAVVDGEEEIEDGQGRKSTDKTLFPHLSKLELRRLPELRWFCHFRYPLELPLLSQMVIEVCPRLNSFSSGSVSSSAHAHMVLFNDKVACPRLGILELDGCKSLRCIFHPSMARVLVNLEELIINDCSKMEAVVDREEEIEGQRRKTTDKTLFPHLNKLELRRLPELRWFCHFRYPLELPLLSQMVIEVCPRLNSFSSASVRSSAHAQMVLFNDEVQFPRLEILELEGLQNMDNIWGTEYPTSSLSKLKFLKAKRCVKLKNIFRPSMAEVFVNLQELIINDCSKMEAVVDGEVIDRKEKVEGGQRRKTDETPFPYFSKLELRCLPEMMRVCQFTCPLELPRLSQMVIEVCPRLNSFSSGRVSFPKLLSRDVSYDFVGDDTTVTEEEEPSKMA